MHRCTKTPNSRKQCRTFRHTDSLAPQQLRRLGRRVRNRHTRKFIRRKEQQGKPQLGGNGTDGGIILLDVRCRQGGQGISSQPRGIQSSEQPLQQNLRRDSSSPPHAHMQAAGIKSQASRHRRYGMNAHHDLRRELLCARNRVNKFFAFQKQGTSFFRRKGEEMPRINKYRPAPRQQSSRNEFEVFGICHMTMSKISQHIQCRQSLAIRGSSHHGSPACTRRQIASQRVGSAYMPRKQADDKASMNFTHHHGGIHGFVLQMGRDSPHGNTRCSDEHMCGIGMKLFFHEI